MKIESSIFRLNVFSLSFIACALLANPEPQVLTEPTTPLIVPATNRAFVITLPSTIKAETSPAFIWQQPMLHPTFPPKIISGEITSRYFLPEKFKPEFKWEEPHLFHPMLPPKVVAGTAESTDLLSKEFELELQWQQPLLHPMLPPKIASE